MTGPGGRGPARRRSVFQSPADLSDIEDRRDALAVQVVAGRAHDADDCVELLAMLGLDVSRTRARQVSEFVNLDEAPVRIFY